MNSYNQIIDEIKQWVSEEYRDSPFIIAQEAMDVSSKKNEEVSLLWQKYRPQMNLEQIEILIITSSEGKENQELVFRLSQAIEKNIAKASWVQSKDIEMNDLWVNLFNESKKIKHILIAENEFYQLANLYKHYTKKPAPALFNIPLFFLADLNSYHHDAVLKKNLWATLLEKLK